jgi:sugar phosphate isomerase/epimerase
LTRAGGLEVLSYGSYYKLCLSPVFTPVLAAACSLGAPLIRVWAGSRGSAEADEGYYEQAAAELRDICRMAAGEGLAIGLEYHRNTLTDSAQSAARLLSLADAENLWLYWQMNPDLPATEHIREISALLPRILPVHVFHWKKGNIRRPLEEGEAEWKERIRLLGVRRNYILEFVKDDREEQLRRDAQTLRRFLASSRNFPSGE